MKRRIEELLREIANSKPVPVSKDRQDLCNRIVTFRTYYNHSLDSPISALALARSVHDCCIDVEDEY